LQDAREGILRLIELNEKFKHKETALTCTAGTILSGRRQRKTTNLVNKITNAQKIKHGYTPY
jgi:hypothetical protein